MYATHKQLGLAVVLALGLVGTGVASATPIHPYVVKLTQQGSNVVASGSGEFNLSGLTPTLTLIKFAQMEPNAGLLLTGPLMNPSFVDAYESTSIGIGVFGNGQGASVNSGTGGLVGFGPEGLLVPHGYSSGAALTSGATWDNASFATLGVTPGTYTWKWGTDADQSFTLDAFTAVPEPAGLGMFGLGLLLIGGFIGLRERGGRRSNKEALS